MKKFLSALLAAVLLLSATACAAHEPVLPPSRWGEGEAKGMKCTPSQGHFNSEG